MGVSLKCKVPKEIYKTIESVMSRTCDNSQEGQASLDDAGFLVLMQHVWHALETSSLQLARLPEGCPPDVQDPVALLHRIRQAQPSTVGVVSKVRAKDDCLRLSFGLAQESTDFKHFLLALEPIDKSEAPWRFALARRSSLKGV